MGAELCVVQVANGQYKSSGGGASKSVSAQTHPHRWCRRHRYYCSPAIGILLLGTDHLEGLRAEGKGGRAREGHSACKKSEQGGWAVEVQPIGEPCGPASPS